MGEINLEIEMVDLGVLEFDGYKGKMRCCPKAAKVAQRV